MVARKYNDLIELNFSLKTRINLATKSNTVIRKYPEDLTIKYKPESESKSSEVFMN